MAEQYRIPRQNIIIDSDGVGGGLADELPGCYAFVNGSTPIQEFDDDPKYRTQETKKFSYRNLRSQCYFRMAETINTGKVGCYADVDPEVKAWIIEELEAIRRTDVDNNESKLAIIPKDEIKEIIGRSPDFSDAMMMRFVKDCGQASIENFEVSVTW